LKINGPLRKEELEKGRQKSSSTYQAKGFHQQSTSSSMSTPMKRVALPRDLHNQRNQKKARLAAIRFERKYISSGAASAQADGNQGRTPLFVHDKSGRLDETQLEQAYQVVRELVPGSRLHRHRGQKVRRERSKGKMTIGRRDWAEGTAISRRQLTIVGVKVTTEQKSARPFENEEGLRFTRLNRFVRGFEKKSAGRLMGAAATSTYK